MSEDAFSILENDRTDTSNALRESDDRKVPDAAGRAPAEKDYFVSRNGRRYAGIHLIVDVFGGTRLDDIDHLRDMLTECVEAAGATLLHIHLHEFDQNGGVSGVAVLAESHISIHSWPEAGYAALDVFMCGDTKPQNCIDVIDRALRPERIEVSEILRGKDL